KHPTGCGNGSVLYSLYCKCISGANRMRCIAIQCEVHPLISPVLGDFLTFHSLHFRTIAIAVIKFCNALASYESKNFTSSNASNRSGGHSDSPVNSHFAKM